MSARLELSPGAVLLPGRLLTAAPALLTTLAPILERAPLRHMQTGRGYFMSVAMTNCGDMGWVSDRRGYRYSALDPISGQAWPPMPSALRELAIILAAEAGFPDFHPDACLINRYDPGARMGLHQDKDEADLSAPIVSCSFGLPAIFLWGGPTRHDKTQKIRLEHGDALIWGGPARLYFHGVQPIRPDVHPDVGGFRLNLTFRQALARP
ncbi:MAG: DNA oxidative demethylase AlkB [Zoogloeaceae bacterium]|nr:DNA oxidative demethylase AlkB [Zoogloeaceae bacterium]